MTDPASHIDALRAEFERAIAAALSEADPRQVRDRSVSRKGGLLSALLQSLGSAPAADRRKLGQLANQLKQDIESRLDGQLDAALRSRRPANAVDVPLPGRRPGLGHRHPLTRLRDE